VRASAFLPRSALIALDLPTFERPANAISAARVAAGPPATGGAQERRVREDEHGEGANSNKIAPSHRDPG